MRNKAYILFVLCLFVAAFGHAQSEVLTLDSCLSSARQRNCTIRSAQLEVLIAREVKKQMLWKYFPQISATGIGYVPAKPLLEYGINDIGSAAARQQLHNLYGQPGTEAILAELRAELLRLQTLYDDPIAELN